LHTKTHLTNSKCAITTSTLPLKAAVYTSNHVLICRDQSTVALGYVWSRTLRLQQWRQLDITAWIHIHDERTQQNCCRWRLDPLFNKSNYLAGRVVASPNGNASVYNLIKSAATA